MSYSAPYIYFVAKTIPRLVKRYLQLCFQVSEDMSDFYLTLLHCPNCIVGLRGYWRNQLRFLMYRVIDEIFRSENPEEMVIVASMVPQEHRLDEWASIVREDFIAKPADECEVIIQLLEMGIIETKDLPASQRGFNQTREPTSRLRMETSQHACEVLANCSDYFAWTRDFQISVEGRLEGRRES